MDAFKKVLEVIDTLLGEGGCSWDREQTFETLQPYLLEECHEALEAVDEGKRTAMIEEFGDLLNVIFFYGKMAERDGLFTIEDVLERLREKLIHRHPHVFGEAKAKTIEEVIKHWEAAKSKEKTVQERKSALEGIPKTLGGLSRAQKTVGRIKRHRDALLSPLKEKKIQMTDEKVLGEELLQLIYHAEDAGLDAESALRRALKKYEAAFQMWEKESN